MSKIPQALDELRIRSGSVSSYDPLVSFLYELMRDHVTPGQVEHLMSQSSFSETRFTNGFLANYAQDVASRLRGNIRQVPEG